MLRRGSWLAGQRKYGLAALLLLLELAAALVLGLATHGVLGPMPPSSTDFLSFYAAGRAAALGGPMFAYDAPTHALLEQQIFGNAQLPYYYFFYPPIFLPLCRLLAGLPYSAAFLVFVGGSALLLGAALWAILPRRAALLLITFPPLFFAAGLGQNSFLTAALFGFGLVLLDRRPTAAGLLLGLLAFKPHFLLILPVALVAGRRWRALAALAAAVAALAAGSYALYGATTWEAYLRTVPLARHVFATGAIPFANQLSVFGALRLIGAPAAVAYAAQALAALLGAGAAAWAWRAPVAPPLRAAILVAATLFAAPVLLLYDLTPMVVAIAWLMRRRRENGWRNGEITAVAALWPLSLLILPLAHGLRLPLGPLATGGLLVLLVAAARRDRALTPRVR